MSFINDDALVPKLCSILILSFTSVIIGLLPVVIHSHYKLKGNSTQNPDQTTKYKRLLAHMSAFGGGVLLSTTFLHLLPEIRKSIEDMKSRNAFSYKDSMQLPELLMCLGFLFLYLIEEIGHTIISNRKRVENEQDSVDRFVNINFDTHMELQVSGQEINGDQVQGRSSVVTTESCEKSLADSKRINSNEIMDVTRHHIHHHGDGDRLSCQNDSMIFFTENSGKNFLLILALSIHECFEGLAIGLERQPKAVWYMVLGVGSHKTVIAFCIGIQMLSSNLERRVTVIYVFMFATATSFGVAIGMFLSVENGIFSVVLQGLASGTLLHIVFFELLKPHSRQTPFTGVFLGFVTMAILKYFSP